jgi:hypothetical protein
MTGEGIKETRMKVELLEMSARSILLAMQAGKINELNREAVRDLSNTMRTLDLPLFGAPGVNKSLEDLYIQPRMRIATHMPKSLIFTSK